MKKTMLIILIITGITFAQRFGASMGTGTYAGYDNFSPKHLTGHFYLPLNDKFSFDFSLGVGMTSFIIETDYNLNVVHDDYENSISISGGNLEALLTYFHKVTGSPFSPFAGLGLGIYSYNRNEENEDDNFKSEATSSGIGQFLTFGLDMNISEKFTAFIQFKKLGFSMIKITDEIDQGGDNNDREEYYDYLSLPGTNDLGISAGLKFSF